MQSLPQRRIIIAIIQLLFLCILFACSSHPVVPPTPTLTATVVSNAPSFTMLPSVTATSQPTSAPLAAIIFIASPDSDQAVATSVRAALTALAGEAKLDFSEKATLTPDELAAGNTRLVVAIPPDPGLASLASAASKTQFLAVGIPGLQPATNLSQINAGAGQTDQEAFLAGYIGAVITTDWRTAVLSEAGTPAGKANTNGFTNGVHFFCGLCQPVYPPFPVPTYPLSMEISAGGGQSEWDVAIANFKEWQVETIYVQSTVSSPELLAALNQAGFHLIGSGSPPGELQAQWVASITTADPAQAVRDLWPALLEGKGGVNVNAPLDFVNVNTQLFSSGRQDLVRQMLADLTAGYIDTGVDPQTGENR